MFFYQDIPKESRKYFKTSYTFLEYVVFAIIFWVNINQKTFRSLIIFSSVLFFVFQVSYVFAGKVKGLDSIPIGIETILIFIYILYFFYEFSKSLGDIYIYNHYGFWIAVGIFIYLGGSFFFFILFEHLTKDQIDTFGILTYFAEIIKNVLFALAIFVYAKFPFKTDNEKPVSIPYLDMI